MTFDSDAREVSAIEPLLHSLTPRGLTISNGMCMAPMARGCCPDNLPDDNVLGYHTRRARLAEAPQELAALLEPASLERLT